MKTKFLEIILTTNDGVTCSDNTMTNTACRMQAKKHRKRVVTFNPHVKINIPRINLTSPEKEATKLPKMTYCICKVPNRTVLVGGFKRLRPVTYITPGEVEFNVYKIH